MIGVLLSGPITPARMFEPSLDRLRSALVSRYVIEHELGAGGMATVYLAHDVRHERRVAVKVLRPELAAVIGAERFLTEIRTTANLQHPHILPLFDSGDAEGFLFYVMPYVEGESLRDRLKRERQLPIVDAVRIASEVASALDYAHRHHVVHRDIKPANVLLHDGQALVADFGIALAVTSASSNRLTETGLSLGTPHYMSPEQATGERDITPRSDVYALGALTYEMLTGEPPFTGPSAQAVVAKVITAEPTPPREVRRSVPEHVDSAVLTALEKLPADRFGSAAEFAAALAGSTKASPRTTGAPHRPRARTRIPVWARAALAGLAAVALVLTGVGIAGTRGDRQDTHMVRFGITLAQPGQGLPVIALSPDGRFIAQPTVDSAGTMRIMVRPFDREEGYLVPGTEGADDVSFSRDGEWLIFTAGRELVRVPRTGGARAVLGRGLIGGSLGVGPDGSVYFTPAPQHGLWRTSSGGVRTRLTELDTARRELGHWNPQVLPDGRSLIYTSYTVPAERSSVVLLDMGSGRTTTLIEGAHWGAYSNTGHLVYVRGEAAFAVPFNLRTRTVHGTPIPLVDDLASVPANGWGGVAVSQNGTFAFIRASAFAVPTQLVRVTRAGQEEVLTAEGRLVDPRLSPDGRFIAAIMSRPNRDVYLFEVARRNLARIAGGPGASIAPVWMPDGRSLIFGTETPVYDIMRVPVDGSRAAETLFVSSVDKYPGNTSADGSLLAFTEVTEYDRIGILSLRDGGAPLYLTDSSMHARHPVLSPDGRWVAYTAGRRGAEVFVTRADGSGGRRQVSVNGGDQPRWTRAGREIVFRRGGAVLAVSFDPASGEPGTPAVLFSGDYPFHDFYVHGYDVSPDGERFVMTRPVQRSPSPTIGVVMNFQELLRERAGERR